MSTHQSHWYMVNLSFFAENNPIPQFYCVFLPMTEKYENINQTMVMQFQNLSKEWVENNKNIKISNAIISGLTYLGHMSNDEFYDK